MNYKNMSTKEIVHSLIKLSAPDRAQELAKLSPAQLRQVTTFVEKNLVEKKDTPGEELLAWVGAGILFLVIWAVVGRLAN